MQLKVMTVVRLSSLSPRLPTAHTKTRNLQSVLVTKYFSGYQIEKNEMLGPYETYGKQERRIQDFGGKT